MSLEQAFSVAGMCAMAGWLALLFSPSGWIRPRILVLPIAFGLGTLYVALIGAFWTQTNGGFDSLADVAALFEHPGPLLAGWVHYLAFDLLVGLWEREEAQRIGLSRLLLAPCLLLTFMFGPAGWLAFLALRHYRLQTGGEPEALRPTLPA